MDERVRQARLLYQRAVFGSDGAMPAKASIPAQHLSGATQNATDTHTSTATSADLASTLNDWTVRAEAHADVAREGIAAR
jgi:hypothetical protein